MCSLIARIWDVRDPVLSPVNRRNEARTLVGLRSGAEAEELKTIAIFCGLGLLISLVVAMSFDLGVGIL